MSECQLNKGGVRETPAVETPVAMSLKIPVGTPELPSIEVLRKAQSCSARIYWGTLVDRAVVQLTPSHRVRRSRHVSVSAAIEQYKGERMFHSSNSMMGEHFPKLYTNGDKQEDGPNPPSAPPPPSEGASPRSDGLRREDEQSNSSSSPSSFAPVEDILSPQSAAVIDLQDVQVVLDLPITKRNAVASEGCEVTVDESLKAKIPGFVWSLGSPFGLVRPPRKTFRKKIITQISGTFLPGRLVALLGPSGAGKTTLLNVLAGRVQHTSGELRFNGEVVNSAVEIKAGTAYIQQQDLFNANLTVREHLATQIKLRAPYLTRGEQSKLCNTLLVRFGLSKCARTIIGPTNSGISGGERKRLSVATEVVNNPRLLLADEPTSGLDSHMAASVVAALRRLADTGRSVVASLHQPSTNIFSLFDEVILMSEGRILYFGDRLGAVEWFRRLGYDCPKLANPADFLIKFVSLPESLAERPAKLAEIEEYARRWQEEGDSFLTWWTDTGRYAFFQSSKTFAEKNIAAVLAEPEDNLGESSDEGRPTHEQVLKQYVEQYTFSLPREILSTETKGDFLPVLPTDSTEATKGNNEGKKIPSPHSAPVRTGSSPPIIPVLQERVSEQLEKLFAHPSPRTSACERMLNHERRRTQSDSCTVQDRESITSEWPMLSQPVVSSNRPLVETASTPPQSNVPEQTQVRQSVPPATRSPPTFGPKRNATTTGPVALEIEAEFFALQDFSVKNIEEKSISWTKQFSILLKREFLCLRRNSILLHARILQMLLVAGTLTSIFWRLGNSDADSRAKLSAIFFLVCNQGLVAAIGVCSTFTEEKVVAHREIEAGVIRVSSYILAKITADLPVQTILPAVFTAICYWGMGLGNDSSFTLYGMLLVTVLVSWSAISVGYLGSACAHNSDQALMFAQIWAIPALLFAGFVVNLNEVPKPLSYLQYVSYFRYGYVAYCYLAFHGREVVYELPTGAVTTVDGDSYVRSYLGFAVEDMKGFWSQIGYLCIMLVVFRSIVLIVAIPASRRWKGQSSG